MPKGKKQKLKLYYVFDDIHRAIGGLRKKYMTGKSNLKIEKMSIASLQICDNMV